MKFEELYASNVKKVFNLALQYVQNYEDAEEITQDTFVTIHQKLNSFNEKSSISTWIYRIAINKSLDFLKAKKRAKRFGFFTSLFYEDSDELRYDKPHFNHPGIQLENKEEIENILKEINKLSDNQKTALILCKIEQKSYAETAEIMETSVKAIESLIHRAKINLSTKLNRSEG